MEVIRGQRIKPPRIVIYGEDKIGKTTFAADAGALVVQTEEGAEEIGVDRLELSASIDHFRKAFAFALESEEHDAIAVDNLTGLEELVRQLVCQRAGVDSIEKVEKGFGKGAAIAAEYWERELIPMFDKARDAGKALICIAHSEVRRAQSPDVDPFDQYGPDLHKDVSSLLRRWADVIGFAQRDVKVTETDVGFGKKERRGVNIADKRVLRLVGAPAYLAGNRYGLPQTIKLGWEPFIDAMNKRAVKASVKAIAANGIEETSDDKGAA